MSVWISADVERVTKVLLDRLAHQRIEVGDAEEAIGVLVAHDRRALPVDEDHTLG